MYIYKFTHVATGKSYIGQTIQDPLHRKSEHISHAKHSSKEYHFHNALRKYGVENFTFEVIDTATSLDELNLLEIKYVELYDSINNGYNIRAPGGNKKHNPESIERMREAQRLRHEKRRLENGGVETINKKSGYKFSKPHPKKGKPSTKWSDEAKAAHKIRMQEIANRKKSKGNT
jgi:group I intron endonuclease